MNHAVKPTGRPRGRRAGPDILSVEDVSVRLGIGKHLAYAAVREGKIPSIRIGQRWLIPRAAFERLLGR